jgi:hypothetical protein
MTKLWVTISLLGMLGLARGAFIFGAFTWLMRSRTRGAGRVPVEMETFEREGRFLRLRVDSRARRWVAALYAGAGPLAWPVLAWRYGGWAAALWYGPAVIGHAVLANLTVNRELPPTWLGWGVPLLYALLALRLASHDHERRRAGLLRQGWRSLGRTIAPPSTRWWVRPAQPAPSPARAAPAPSRLRWP